MSPDLEYIQCAVVNSARTLLNTLYGQYRQSHDIMGFKEVRYGGCELELLRRCYPEAEILLLVRHPYKTWNSTPRDWYVSLDAWAANWEERTRAYIQASISNARCHLIRHEDVVAQEEKVLKILTDVAKVSREQISDVLAHKIGSFHYGIEEFEQQVIRERCREPMQALGYI